MNAAPVNAVQDRVEAFDVLRGVAILGVVLVHARGDGMVLPDALSWLVSQGARGVQLFFVVSAMTLMAAWHRQSGRGQGTLGLLGGFFARRFARIAPMFYVGALLSLAIGGLGPRDWAPHGIGPGDVLATLSFTHGWNPVSFNSVVPGGWSIACEATFYLLFPLIVATATTLRRAVALFVLSLLVRDAANALLLGPILAPYAGMPVLAEGFASLWFPNQLPVFLAGVVGYFVLAGTAGAGLDAACPRAVLTRLPALLVCGLATLALPGGFARYGVAFALLAVPAYLLCGAVRPVAVRAALGGLAWIGRISFSMYIVQFPLLALIHALVPGVGVAALLAVLALATAASAAVSALTWRWIEEPAIRLGRRVSRRMEAARA